MHGMNVRCWVNRHTVFWPARNFPLQQLNFILGEGLSVVAICSAWEIDDTTGCHIETMPLGPKPFEFQSAGALETCVVMHVSDLLNPANPG
jgi:hypothetical protein